jgi:hypothetical protein
VLGEINRADDADAPRAVLAGDHPRF